MESIYKKFRQELEQVESGFVRPQIDRQEGHVNNAGNLNVRELDQATSALSVFNEGFAKFIETNEFEIADIENQTT